MQIAFHIGANCTDNDRLLKSLLKNVDGFAEQRIKVPGPGKYRRLIRETIQNLDGMPPAPETRGILLDAILDGDAPDRLVLSNANFICIANRIFDGGVFYEQTAFKVRGFLDLFAPDEVSFFLGIRNPATFLPAALRDSKAQTLETFLRGVPPTEIRWSDVVRRLQDAAPGRAITVWCNEDTPLIWADLIRRHAGLAPDARITGGYDLLAAIMSGEGMNRFLNYLRSHPPRTETQKRRIIGAFLDKYALEDAIEEEVDVPGMTAALVDDLSAAYEADVAQIAQMPGVTFVAP